jgi:hypothetical protein
MGFLDIPGVKPGALDAAVRDKINDPASNIATALNATYALKSELPPTSLDGGNAASTYSGTYNFDGGSAA